MIGMDLFLGGLQHENRLNMPMLPSQNLLSEIKSARAKLPFSFWCQVKIEEGQDEETAWCDVMTITTSSSHHTGITKCLYWLKRARHVLLWFLTDIKWCGIKWNLRWKCFYPLIITASYRNQQTYVANKFLLLLPRFVECLAYTGNQAAESLHVNWFPVCLK